MLAFRPRMPFFSWVAAPRYARSGLLLAWLVLSVSPLLAQAAPPSTDYRVALKT